MYCTRHLLLGILLLLNDVREFVVKEEAVSCLYSTYCPLSCYYILGSS